MKHLIIRTKRECYDVSEVRGMTVGDIIEKLREFDENAIVALSFDGGYMYGGVSNIFSLGWLEYDTFKEVSE